jgi:aldose 1-epimerase
MTDARGADRVILRRAGWICEIDPALGGAIVGLAWGERPILRRTEPGARHPFDLSSFALLPYANRIANGAFTFAGRAYVLPPNIPGEAHPLHGVGLSEPWRVCRQTESAVVLALDHAGSPHWPWAFAARQEIAVGEDGFAHRLEIRNCAKADCPAGLGFHPYFAPAAGARLTARLTGVWTTDEHRLPAAHSIDLPRGWREGAAVSGSDLIDHCHGGWDGTARIQWDDGLELALTASPNLGHLHIYAPPEADFFCLEPVSHRPDAINAPFDSPGAMALLSPGATLAAWMRLTAPQRLAHKTI